jgi:hypothetical protein
VSVEPGELHFSIGRGASAAALAALMWMWPEPSEVAATRIPGTLATYQHSSLRSSRRRRAVATRIVRLRRLSLWESRSSRRGSHLRAPGLFVREILPLIRELPLSDLVRATGLTHGHLSQVRRGAKVPHPRHWAALRDAGSPCTENDLGDVIAHASTTSSSTTW